MSGVGNARSKAPARTVFLDDAIVSIPALELLAINRLQSRIYNVSERHRVAQYDLQEIIITS